MIRQLRWGWREAKRTGRDPESEKIGSGDGTGAVELQRSCYLSKVANPRPESFGLHTVEEKVACGLFILAADAASRG
ncbi:hypothetical protein AAC387_Pa07g2173 [Persea americana]